MNPKDYRVGATLRLNDVTVTHRYDDYFVVRFASGETMKLKPEDVDSVVSQPIEEGDLIRRVGIGGQGRFIGKVSGSRELVVVQMQNAEPSVCKLSQVSLVDPNNPKGPIE